MRTRDIEIKLVNWSTLLPAIYHWSLRQSNSFINTFISCLRYSLGATIHQRIDRAISTLFGDFYMKIFFRTGFEPITFKTKVQSLTTSASTTSRPFRRATFIALNAAVISWLPTDRGGSKKGPLWWEQQQRSHSNRPGPNYELSRPSSSE